MDQIKSTAIIFFCTALANPTLFFICNFAHYGYKFTLLTLTKNDGFIVLIFTSPITIKKMADTTYCGPPFLLFLGYLDIWPKSPVVVSTISANISS